MKKIKNENLKIAVIGLGYVGLPLAIEFGKKFRVVGFDVSIERINQLKRQHDFTYEVSAEDLKKSVNVNFTHQFEDLNSCDIYIVTVPTPVDKFKNPDLSPLISACEIVGTVLSENNLVIFESTVFPGATEEFCVPVLEQFSNLRYNHDFHVGYSPERINPGDKQRRLTDIVKITSGSTDAAAQEVDCLYQQIILAGTHKASSIKVAEAAKVIENTQRDVNIGLINELSLIFDHMQIDTLEVLNAAETKWNFLPFKPGLVGGHCIGIDPYYLCYKAQEFGYIPDIILSGRRVNDSMGKHVAVKMLKMMSQKGINLQQSSVIIFGLTFKENCPDIRNTKVVDIVNELKEFGVNVSVYDPNCNAEDALSNYGIIVETELQESMFDGIILAVPHDCFCQLGIEEIRKVGKKKHVLYDLKGMFDKASVDARL